MLTLDAPAKLNLTLEVLGRRDDGYHEIRSLVQTIDLHDTLHFHEAENTTITADGPGWDARLSLVSRAVALLQEETGCRQGVRIHLAKRIPLMSGLGGDSSDAAATLVGLNRLWELGLEREQLEELAARLGSDVPFFVRGGTALVAGRGERVTPLPPLPERWVVLVLPPVMRQAGKTARAYAALTPEDFTDGSRTEQAVAALRAGRVQELPLFNAFERTAFTGRLGLAEYRWQMLAAGAPGVHLAGSGPALFSLLPDRASAASLQPALEGLGLHPLVVKTRPGTAEPAGR